MGNGKITSFSRIRRPNIGKATNCVVLSTMELMIILSAKYITL